MNSVFWTDGDRKSKVPRTESGDSADDSDVDLPALDSASDSDMSSDDESADSDDDVHTNLQRTLVERKRGDKGVVKQAEKQGFEVVPANHPRKFIKKSG